MKESLQSFVVHQNNASAFDAIISLNGRRRSPLKLLIEGPRRSGKSSLVRGFANDAEQNGIADQVFICSGSDISMALQFEADDSFFDRLGSVPILLIDDAYPLIHYDTGDFFLSLLLAERDRQNFSTVITSDSPFDQYSLVKSKDLISTFETIKVCQLDAEGQKRLRSTCAVYLPDAAGSDVVQ